MAFNFFTTDNTKIAREEMEHAGFLQLLTKVEVDEQLKKPGTTLALINSICGCAGSIARPAVTSAGKSSDRPDHLVTVFAGQDQEATEALRAYFPEVEKTSPGIVLLQDGVLVKLWGRDQIEGRLAFLVMNDLEAAFKELKTD